MSQANNNMEEAMSPSKGGGRRKIKIEYIQDKNKRHITFSKRKSGIMKKAHELATLTGTEVLLLVVSETGLVYTFSTAKLQPIVSNAEGKQLIQQCLNHTTLQDQDDGHQEDETLATPQVVQDAQRQQMPREHEPTMARSAPSAHSLRAPPSPTPRHHQPSDNVYPSYPSQAQLPNQQQPDPLYAYGYPQSNSQAYPVVSYPHTSSMQPQGYWADPSSSSTFQRQ